MYGGAAMAPQESRVERRTLSHFDEARYADTTICKVHNLCILDVCTTLFPSTTISSNNSVYNFHLWAATIQGEGWLKKSTSWPKLCQIKFRVSMIWPNLVKCPRMKIMMQWLCNWELLLRIIQLLTSCNDSLQWPLWWAILLLEVSWSLTKRDGYTVLQESARDGRRLAHWAICILNWVCMAH